jgi:hypothetical protein
MSPVILIFLASMIPAGSGTAAHVPGLLSFEVELEIDGDDDEYIPGKVGAVEEDSKGNIYIAAIDQDTVLKFSHAGVLEGTLGSAGSGPGTIMPHFCFALGGGDEFYLTGSGGRIEVVDTGWGYLRTLERVNSASLPRAIATFPDGGFAISVPGQSTDTTIDIYDSSGTFMRSISPAFSFNKGYPRHMERPFVGGLVVVSSTRAASSDEGATLLCAYNEELDLRGSLILPFSARVVGVGSGNMAYIATIGVAGPRVQRVAFSVGDP